jgi:hypothetical protein
MVADDEHRTTAARGPFKIEPDPAEREDRHERGSEHPCYEEGFGEGSETGRFAVDEFTKVTNRTLSGDRTLIDLCREFLFEPSREHHAVERIDPEIAERRRLSDRRSEPFKDLHEPIRGRALTLRYETTHLVAFDLHRPRTGKITVPLMSSAIRM